MSERGDKEVSPSLAQERGLPSFVWRAGQERRLDMVQRHVPLAGLRVLDAGCGIGMYMQAFIRRGAHAFGVEIELERAARARGAGLSVVAGSVEKLPFADDSFDCVFSHEVVEHVADDRAAILEAARILRPGGRLVLFAPNRWYPFETHGIVWRGRYRFGNIPLINYLPGPWRERLCPHARAYTRRQILNLFSDTPLRVVRHTVVFPGFDNIVARRPRIGRPLRALFHWLERTPFQALGLSHFIVAMRQPAGPDRAP